MRTKKIGPRAASPRPGRPRLGCGSGVAVALALVVGMATIGCAANQAPIARTPTGSACGDQCRALSCPADSHCALSGNCTPRCELNALQRN